MDPVISFLGTIIFIGLFLLFIIGIQQKIKKQDIRRKMNEQYEKEQAVKEMLRDVEYRKANAYRKSEEERKNILKEKYGNFSIEDIVFDKQIDYRDKVDILIFIHNFLWDEANAILKTAEKESKKAHLLSIKKKISQKAFELYSEIPVDDRRAPLSDEVKLFVWNRDGAKCVKCGSKEKLEFDHIIPYSKGGSDTARNIQLLCEKCNRSKGAELL